MNAERLLRHYEQIADAPDAIARLRRFILDLTVRGKLVPQDPTDEPASKALKRIDASERSGGAFTLPASWAWVDVAAVAETRLGKMLDKARNKGIPRPYLRNINVRWFDFDLSDLQEMPFEDTELDEFALHSGDVLICEGGEPGRAAVWDERARGVYFQKAIHRVRFTRLVDSIFFVYALKASANDGRLAESFTGTGIKHFTGKGLNGYCFPLPPIAEQHRIVAKVNELMALCDELEAARTERETKRDRLAAASLARLDTPDPETFRDDARFALDAMPALTARPDQIKQLRQTILNLAVRGKLVPQDPTDEPAAELLKRFFADKKRLMAEKGIRGQKPALPAENFEIITDIPWTWQHVYLQDIAYQITDGTHLTPKYTETGKPFLSAQNVKPFRFMPEKRRFVSEQDFDSYRANRRPERGDILLTRVGAGIGEAAVLDSDFEFAFYVSLCLIKVPTSCINVEYLVLWLNSPEGRDSSSSRTYGKGASQGNLNLGLIRTFKIPLPPLAEQHRIVAKVDELMALCDQLETSLTSADETRKKLLDALLAEALAPLDADALQEAAE